MTPVDLLILGGGSAAFSAARVASDAGRTVAIVERRSPGGACPNVGCVPSKFLIEAAAAYHRGRFPRHPGLASRPDLPVDFARLVAEKDAWVLSRRKHYEHPDMPGVSVVRGNGTFVSSDTIVLEDGRRLTGRAVLVATGSDPVLPEIGGLADVPYLTSDLLAAQEAGELTDLPASALVVGGGYVGLELGQMLHRFGCRVTVLARGPRPLDDGYEPEVRDGLAASLATEGLDVVYNTDVVSVRRETDGVAADVTVAGGRRALTAARLILATGRKPTTAGLNLAAAGVETDVHSAIVVDATMRTSSPSVYAAGDAVGRQQGSQMATPMANVEGQIAAHNALRLGPPRHIDGRVVPRTIFTDPQVAVVGLTEAAARSAGHDVWVGRVPMAHVPRATLMRQPDGLVKMVADRATHRLLGVSLVGPEVAEVIHEAAMGLRLNATVDDFADLIHVFPAVAEALKIVAVKMRRDAKK